MKQLFVTALSKKGWTDIHAFCPNKNTSFFDWQVRIDLKYLGIERIIIWKEIDCYKDVILTLDFIDKFE
jgi:hypothetical protein